MLLPILLLANGVFLAGAVVFTWDSLREKEQRAVKVGFGGILSMVVLGTLILLFPGVRPVVAILFALLILLFLLLLIPARSNPQTLKGTEGYIVGEIGRVDERDIVFARNRSLPPGSEVYKRYYEMHPEREERDAKRRAAGGPLGKPGSIDGEHHPNLAMLKGTFHLPLYLGQKEKVEPSPEPSPVPIDPKEATERIKGFARHLGADLVGVCRVGPHWAYSNRGEIFFDNWDDWGKEIPPPLPFAIVMAEEMDAELVRGAPHTSSVVESGMNYAKGAYITTILANFIAHLGYPAVAHHLRHYDLVLVPVAVDAGLGELGRFGGVGPIWLSHHRRIRTPGPVVGGDDFITVGTRQTGGLRGTGILRLVSEVRRHLSLRLHPEGREGGLQRGGKVEARGRNVFRLLGKGRDRLQHLYGGLPL